MTKKLEIFDIIKVGKPKELKLSIDEYISGVFKIIDSQNKEKPMLIKPTKEELEQKYNNSICIVDGKEIIANSSIDSEKIKGFENFKVATMGTLIVKNEKKYRGKGLGKFLLEKSHEFGKEENDILISLTFNETVSGVRKKIGYYLLNNTDLNIPFEYLEKTKEAFMKAGEFHNNNSEKSNFNDPFLFYNQLYKLIWINKKIPKDKLDKIIKVLYNENYKYKQEILNLTNK